MDPNQEFDGIFKLLSPMEIEKDRSKIGAVDTSE